MGPACQAALKALQRVPRGKRRGEPGRAGAVFLCGQVHAWAGRVHGRAQRRAGGRAPPQVAIASSACSASSCCPALTLLLAPCTRTLQACLAEIIQQGGRLSAAEAGEVLAEMARQKRYVRDIWT